MTVMKKYIPNILTTVRIGCSFCIIFSEASSFVFIVFYVIAGFSDMLDGFTARHFDAGTAFGEKYDSFADIIFIGVCLLKLLPLFPLPLWSMIWVGLIAVIKLTNLLFSYAYHRKKLFLHTIANKVTGAMLFITPIVLVWVSINYVIPVVCTVATFAAVQEGHLIRTGKTEVSK